MVRADDACRRKRRRSPGRGGFTLIELMVVMAIMLILAGLITSTIFVFKRIMQRKGAKVDISTFTMGLAAYKRDLGSYPPVDIGGAQYSANEVLHYYLGRKHLKGANYYGPYVTFKTRRLRDADGDGLLEYPDPFGGYYEYGLVTEVATGEVLRYEIVSPGYDGEMGGEWDIGGGAGDSDIAGEYVIGDQGDAADDASLGGH